MQQTLFLLVTLFLSQLAALVCAANEVKVRILPRKPSRVIRIEELGIDSIARSINDLSKRWKITKDTPGETILLAWAVKTDINNLPPSITEEVIALVKWKDSGRYSLFYLTGLRTHDPDNIDWHAQSYWDAAGLRWIQDFEERPNEEEVCEFVIASNFAKNELEKSITTIDIVLYEAEMKELEAILNKGLSDKERWQRREAVIRVLGTPE